MVTQNIPLVKWLAHSRFTNGVPFPFPFPFPFGMPTPPVNTVPPAAQAAGSRIRKQDWRNDSTPVRLFIAAFCQPPLFRLHIYFYILLCHTWFLRVVEKWRGWVDEEGGRCRRWRQMA